jgi:hypothetical protein
MTTQKSAAELTVPNRVFRALDLLGAAKVRAQKVCADTHSAKARKMARIAALYEREARWWDVLEDWTYSRESVGVPLVYGRAVIVAQRDAKDSARTYRDLEANYWRRTFAVVADSGVAA